jgi:hypothetical protein
MMATLTSLLAAVILLATNIFLPAVSICSGVA